MPQMRPLPPGFDPVTAGRLGLWLMGLRNHSGRFGSGTEPEMPRSMKTLVSRQPCCVAPTPWRSRAWPAALPAIDQPNLPRS
jgi:hypothetical protein